MIRLWRVRRRGQWIDATLELSSERWRLTFSHKGRVLAALDFGSEDEAREAAVVRLRELERAGWSEHW